MTVTSQVAVTLVRLCDCGSPFLVFGGAATPRKLETSSQHGIASPAIAGSQRHVSFLKFHTLPDAELDIPELFGQHRLVIGSVTNVHFCNGFAFKGNDVGTDIIKCPCRYNQPQENANCSIRKPCDVL